MTTALFGQRGQETMCRRHRSAKRKKKKRRRWWWGALTGEVMFDEGHQCDGMPGRSSDAAVSLRALKRFVLQLFDSKAANHKLKNW